MDLSACSDTALVEVAGYRLRTFIDDDDAAIAHVVVGTERGDREEYFTAAWDGEELERVFTFSRNEVEDTDIYRAIERALERLQRELGEATAHG